MTDNDKRLLAVAEEHKAVEDMAQPDPAHRPDFGGVHFDGTILRFEVLPFSAGAQELSERFATWDAEIAFDAWMARLDERD